MSAARTAVELRMHAGWDRAAKLRTHLPARRALRRFYRHWPSVVVGPNEFRACIVATPGLSPIEKRWVRILAFGNDPGLPIVSCKDCGCGYLDLTAMFGIDK